MVVHDASQPWTIVAPNFSNGGEAFGLAALEFDKITLVVDGGKFVVPAEGGVEGDFQVRNL